MSITDLENLANTRFEIKTAKLSMLERLEAQLTFAYNGGLFKATPELLTMLDLYFREDYLEIVILDVYDNPIKVEVGILFDKAVEAHQCALNKYLNDYNEVKRVRKGDKL